MKHKILLFFHYFNYLLIRSLGEFFALMPRPLLLAIGRILGSMIYIFHRPFRKKAMTSLSIAFGKTKSEKWLKQTARRSFQNLLITCLEFISMKKTQSFYRIEGGDDILELLKKGQGVVFLSAHQANWEIPFLAITSRYRGIAIGRPIKNKFLYRWIISVRENFGGRIVAPKNALKEGIKALQEGKFIGIVGDQGYPEGTYSYPLFGTRAWTSTAPAVLAYRTNSPLVVATNERKKGTYIVSGSNAIWPDLSKPMKDEIPRLMNEAMSYLEKSIEKKPAEWLWQHDRWKQQKIDHVKRDFRYAFILITLPPDPSDFLPLLPLFKEIYPRGFCTVLAPKNIHFHFNGDIIHYEKKEDLFLRDYRFQIVYDFYNCASLRRHFKKLSAFKTLSLNDLKKLSGDQYDLTKTLLTAVCKKDAPRSLFY